MTIVRNLDIHPIRVEKENTMGTRHAMFKVHRVNSVQIRPCWNPICIPRPESKCGTVCGDTKGVRVFS